MRRIYTQQEKGREGPAWTAIPLSPNVRGHTEPAAHPFCPRSPLCDFPPYCGLKPCTALSPKQMDWPKSRAVLSHHAMPRESMDMPVLFPDREPARGLAALRPFRLTVATHCHPPWERPSFQSGFIDLGRYRTPAERIASYSSGRCVTSVERGGQGQR